MVIELIPIGTVLALITSQLLDTAQAALDVVIEKESFNILSNLLKDMQPLLVELKKRDLKDSPGVRTALESIQEDLKKAGTLIDNCTNKSKMYLLLRCRSILQQNQEIVRNLGKSLELLGLASAEIAGDIMLNVNTLTNQMVRVQFQTSETKLHVVRKLEQGIREQRTDQGFANDVLMEIAKVLGIAVNADAIGKELASFKREKEEMALKKELEEEAYMEQVITLLSRAEASYLPETSKETYFGRLLNVRSTVYNTEFIAPLKFFLCPLTNEVMVDPVSLVNGSCFERSAITAWFSDGNNTDPVTHEQLTDTTLRPNIPVRKSIEEWQERNYCIGIDKARDMLRSGDEYKEKAALDDLINLCEKSKATKDWIAEAGLIEDIISALKYPSRDVKRKSLSALHVLVKGNRRNQDFLLDAGGLEQIVRCMSREASVAKVAVVLLLELLEGDPSLSVKIGRERSAILLFVTLMKGRDSETAGLARQMLDKLAVEDDNVVAMASANWYPPLVQCLKEGKEEVTDTLMAKTLAKLESTDESKMNLADLGVIPPLVRIIESGRLEAKLAALKAVESLCTHRTIKTSFATAGGVPIVLNHLFSGMSPPLVRESAASILHNLAQNDGIEFFLDSSGAAIDGCQTVENLLAVYENSSIFPVIRRHVLFALLGMLSAPNSERLRSTFRNMRGIPTILPLMEGQDREVRDCVTQLLFYLSENGFGSEMADQMKQQTYKSFSRLLANKNVSEEVQVAAAGFLVNLPAPDPAVTEALVEAEAISPLVELAKTTNPKVKEAALDALVRFTDPSNIELQKIVAELNLHVLLVRTLLSGTVKSKARAATALKNFSLSTSSLCKDVGMTCTCFPVSLKPVCKVHKRRCDFKTTFCIVAADALTGLVTILNEDRGIAAEAAVEALETLVSEDRTLESGAQLLHQLEGIAPLLDLLSEGTPELKEKTLRLLERVFSTDTMKELYGSTSRLRLVEIATYGSSYVRRSATRILGKLRYIDEVATYTN